MKVKALELNLREKKSCTETCKQYSLSDFSSLEALACDKFGETGFCVFFILTIKFCSVDTMVLVSFFIGKIFRNLSLYRK